MKKEDGYFITVVILLVVIIISSIAVIINRKILGQKLQSLTGVNPFLDYNPMVNTDIKRNNPLNIRHSGSFNWVGEDTTIPAGSFASFDTLDNGIRAAIQNLHTYVTKDGANTIKSIIARWAPPSDNNDDVAYEKVVMEQLTPLYPGLTSDTVLTGNYSQLALIAWAMSAMEQGYSHQPDKQLFINEGNKL